MARFAAVVVTLTTLAGLEACVADGGDEPSSAPSSTGPSQATSPRVSPTTSPTPPDPASHGPLSVPDSVRVATAVRAVRHLAGRIGPRPGTSPAYLRAAAWVGRQLADEGWEVRRQRFHTPAGVSWGVPVPDGRSVNLIATRGDVQPGRPWLAVGAHLDTVPQAPGAEDNASGIGVLLTVAEALRDTRTRLPVVLVAFGSEEPRGSTDDDHHYGSRAFVADLGARERRSLRGMVALDRVGVGEVVPVSSARGPDPMRAQLLAAARRAEVPTEALTGDRASDHWSFVRAGLPAARLGSTPYVGYHSAGDVPAVVDRDQLDRTARTVVAWLAPR
jgi:aminopeptidase YwaD